jgi:hypothetical protein
MKQTATALEFLNEAQSNPTKGWREHKAMIEFAKLHVKAALEAASKSSKVRKDTYVMGRGTTEVEQMFNYSNGTSHYVDQDSILNSYPLENIK